MSVSVDDIVTYLEKRYSPNLAAKWDKSGWQYKGSNKKTNSVVICLDVTKRAVELARDNDARLILSHHPIMFEMPVYLDCNLYPTSTLIESIRSDISIYSLHTNIDSASGGMNDYFANILGMNEIAIPEISEDPDKEANFSRIGSIQSISFDELLQKCYRLFNIGSLRLVGIKPDLIRRIVVAAGSGSSIIKKLDPNSFDLAITGDLKYHDALFFKENGYCVIDVGHFIEQKLFTEIIQNSLEEIYGNNLRYIKSIEENCLKGVSGEPDN